MFDFALAAQITGFVVMGGFLIAVESQNRSLQRQVTEQREVGHQDRLTIAHQDKEIAALQQLANEAVESKQIVEQMNRMLVDEYVKKNEAQAKRRATLAAKKEDA